ncbi:MAG: sulfite dehydrogenase [Gemmatimonadaceae bacterium]
MTDKSFTDDSRDVNSAKPRAITRRDAIVAAGATLLATGIPLHGQLTERPPIVVPPDPTKVQGRLPTELGQRSTFENPRREVFVSQPAGWSGAPLQDLRGIITPSDLHYERHHAGIPAIDPKKYTLLIHGMCERQLKFTLDDLKRFPSVSRIHFIECSGNGVGLGPFTDADRKQTPQDTDGLLSTSEWTGVPLAVLFKEVGISPDARWFLAEGSDAARMTRSIPIEKAFDDAMIAYGQNGEAVRPEQGYPARLLLPGWEGNTNVKWIQRIEIGDRPWMTREETSKYTDPLANGTARQFSFVMDCKSLITFPAYPDALSPGWWEVTGLAWSGRGNVTRVEVSVDRGRSWEDAELQAPVLSKCTTRFRYLWKYNGGEAYLMSRATDETGYVQPTRAQLVATRGPGTSYHNNDIRCWKVESDGHVFFDTEL